MRMRQLSLKIMYDETVLTDPAGWIIDVLSDEYALVVIEASSDHFAPVQVPGISCRHLAKTEVVDLPAAFKDEVL